jgi:hypothetical protein
LDAAGIDDSPIFGTLDAVGAHGPPAVYSFDLSQLQR